MERIAFGEAADPRRHIMGPLDHVAAGLRIAFDDDGTLVRDGHVPANRDAIREGRMGPADQVHRLSPKRQTPALDLSIAEWMTLQPDARPPDAGIGGRSQLAGPHVDLRDDAAPMEVVDDCAFAG